MTAWSRVIDPWITRPVSSISNGVGGGGGGGEVNKMERCGQIIEYKY